MVKFALVMAIVALLTGCAQFQAAQSYGATTADGILEGSVYGACVAPTVGSLVRRYGNDADGRAAWEIFCSHEWARGAGDFSLPDVAR